LSNDKDILNNLERIESLMDGIWELNKVYRTSEETSARMRPHLPANWVGYQTVETFPVGEHVYGYDNRKAPLYHHVYRDTPLSNGYTSFLHAISVSPEPFDEHAILSSSSMGSKPVEEFLKDPWPAKQGNVNIPWQDGHFASVGETATGRGSQGYGIGTLLYRQMLKYHGRLASDVSTSQGVNKVWDKLLSHPDVKGETGFGDKYHRHWAEWHGEPMPPAIKALDLKGESYSRYLERQRMGKSEEDLAKTIGHLSFDGLKVNIHDPQEFGIIAPISEPVAVTRPRQMEIFQRAHLNRPEDHSTPEKSKRTGERAKQLASTVFGSDPNLVSYGWKNTERSGGANVNWDERVTRKQRIPKPKERRHFSFAKEGAKLNLLGIKEHEKEHSLFDLVARKYGSPFRYKLAEHLVQSMPEDSRNFAKMMASDVSGQEQMDPSFNEEIINVHHNFLMSPEYRKYAYHVLRWKGFQDPQKQRQLEDAMKRGWQHLMRASRQVRPNHIDPSISINDVPIPKKPKREEVVAKSESLVKMAIADIKPSDTGDYSHLVPEHLRDDYSIYLEESDDADYDKSLVAKVYYRGQHAGSFVGNIIGDSIVTHQWLNSKHHNKKLGNAGMEAVLAHAFHKFGVKKVADHDHTVAASRVHESLSRKHGMGYEPIPLDEDNVYHEGYVIKSEDKVHSSSDPVVYDIGKAPEQHLTPEFYRITPQVQQAYEMMGRGRAVAHGQFISDPSPSIGSGVTVAFDNDEDLHNYIKDVYEPHLKKNVLPSMVPDKSVILAPIPTKSIRHGNQSPFLTIDHLHGVSLSQDRRGRIPFYYTMSKLASELGHAHPMIPPAISEYTEGPHQHHVIRMVDGNGRTVSARTAGSSHVLSYVAMKPEHVHPFLKMLHETSPNENLVVRSILGVNDLPSEFTIKDIPTVISHTKKAEEDILNTLNRMEVLFDALAGRR
jgi:hypothetical protein